MGDLSLGGGGGAIFIPKTKDTIAHICVLTLRGGYCEDLRCSGSRLTCCEGGGRKRRKKGI